MVENACENLVDRKSSVVDSFVEIKLTKLKASIKVEAHIKVKASVRVEASSVNSENRAEFTVIIKRSCAIRNLMLELVCERSCEHKVPKKKVKHEATGSWKCGCLFKVCGYVFREDSAWKLAIINGVHNHEMMLYLAGHLLAGRLMEDDKKIVHDLSNISMKPKIILTNLKKKGQESMTNIKQVCNERHKFKRGKKG
ncbi:hypothetical protein MTR_2g067930 [Medicago truncatula]|uniref:FAR1 DNA-binding domain protein n=1 Tax=Medicago truncatula TaxID=3880 RepID=A0A072V9N3_MEDTR|nr:hypothetical protein MTR_2g067930 [Medicago truncatula]